MLNKPLLIWRYLFDVAGLKSTDVWLPSFPKAGSTWMRFIVCNLISIAELDGRTPDFHFVETTLPTMGRRKLLQSWPYQSLPRFIKTHQPYRRGAFAVPRRVVYILRDPRDIMVSFYHFRKVFVKPFEGTFDQFIRHEKFGLRACLQHYASWQPRTTHLLHYEALKQDTFTEFKMMLEGIGVEIADEHLLLAIERSSIGEMRKAQEQHGHPYKVPTKFRFVRKGETRQWPHYFSDEDQAFYEQVCREFSFTLYP